MKWNQKKSEGMIMGMLLMLMAGFLWKLPVQAMETSTEEEVFAPETADSSGSCGANVTWAYNSGTKTLRISGTGEMNDYYPADTMPWYDIRSEIENVIIENGVTLLSDSSFKGCSNLTSVSLPDSITKIGAGMFRECSSLSSISLPSGLESIGNYGFADCTGLNNLSLPESLTKIGWNAFENCSSLSSIVLPEGITEIDSSVFSGCSSLKNVSLPTGLTSVGANVFKGCSSLESIMIPDGVTSLGRMVFDGCSSLSSISLPSGITSIEDYAFRGCEKLSSILLPEGITEIGDYAFEKCAALTGISIPDGVTSIGKYTFWDCSNLTSISLPDSLTGIGNYAFWNCKKLSNISLPTGLTSMGTSTFMGCSSLASATVGCDWKSNSLYSFGSGVTLEYGHAGPVIYVADDTNDKITMTCDACNASESVKLEAPANRIYTGEQLEAVITNGLTQHTPVITYSGANLAEGKPVNAGTYTATMTVSDGMEEWSVSLEYEIEKADSACTAPVAKTLEYTGQAQALVDPGTVSGGTLYYSLKQNDSYTTSIPQGMDAKTYTVYYKVVGDSNHKDIAVKSVDVTIQKADGVISGSDSYIRSYSDGTFAIDAAANHTESELQYEVTAGEDVISISGKNIHILKAGEATVRISLSESSNYNSAEKNVTVTVQKKTGHATENINRSYLYLRENADNVNLTQLLPADCGTASYEVLQIQGDVSYSVTPVVDNGVLSYTVNPGETDAQGIIVLKVTTDNYQDFPIVINIKLHNQKPVRIKDGMEVTLTDNILTYGDALSRLQINSVEFEDENGNAVAGVLEWKNPQIVPNAGTTSAIWLFTPDNAEYATLEGTVGIVVNKAVPTVVELPVVAEQVYHPTESLTDSKLTGGVVDVDGTWCWNVSGILPTVDNEGYEAVFMPADTINYETVTRTIEVKVTKATPYIQTLPEATPITYGETLVSSALTQGMVQYSEQENMPIAGSFAWMVESNKPKVAESEMPVHAVIFIPADTVNYNTVEAMIGLMVNKAPYAPNMPADVMSVPMSLGTVSKVALPDNWEWKAEDKEKELKAGTSVVAVAEYVGADRENYENITVTVSLNIIEAVKEWTFTDVTVKSGHWKYEAVKYVYENNIMNGINGTTLFQPDESINRAMFATVLYRLAGSPQITFENVFPDVEEGRYYSDAVVWAKKQGMVVGYGDGSYGVNYNITREQIAKILYEYAAGCGYDVSGKASLDAFTDKETVSEWAEGYIQWAVDTGMIEGKPNDDGGFRLDPKGDATRAECAKMLRYFMEKYK